MKIELYTCKSDTVRLRFLLAGLLFLCIRYLNAFHVQKDIRT